MGDHTEKLKVKDDEIKELNTKVRNLAKVVGGFERTALQLTSSHGPQHLQLCQHLQLYHHHSAVSSPQLDKIKECCEQHK